MKILCDEHVPPAVASTLRSEGIDAVSVTEELEPGAEDGEIIRYASEHGCLALTNDTDYFDATDHYGILYYDDQETSRRDLVRAV